ncbi:26S proteasome complex subunit DSS1-like protein [Leptotrombidium deliense]|uniref:26S proteasome complex subunit SEM1 n=1 Tax=Leptotrombidium deliense TaxID=299467 RepID=A0A443S901_9ACAR|nr:26S proteasome complex subunit DSS1-like protein [Leptotrombidium deliense]
MNHKSEEKKDSINKDVKEKIDLGLLEEDDEFEEFPVEEWKGKGDDQELSIWEDNWEDDNIEDDFSKQLKSELEKQK